MALCTQKERFNMLQHTVSNVQIHGYLNTSMLTEFVMALVRGTLEGTARSKNPLIRHFGETYPPPVLEEDD